MKKVATLNLVFKHDFNSYIAARQATSNSALKSEK